MRVAIAIHGNNNIDFGVYVNHLSLMAIASQNKNYEIALTNTKGVRIAQARNVLVDHAKGLECDFIFFLDTDHIVDWDIVDRLLADIKGTGASMVSGLVCRRRDKMDHIGYNKIDNMYQKLRFTLEGGGSLCKVDVCPFGCTLVDMQVFDELKRPFFKDTLEETASGEIASLRSDAGFCLELKKLNKIVLVDTRIHVGHVGEPIVIYPKTSNELSRLAKDKVLGFTHP